MATVQFTDQVIDFGSRLITWPNLKANDDGAPYALSAEWGDKSVQVVASNWGIGSSLTMQGANAYVKSAPTQWDTLEDPEFADLVFTAASTIRLKAILANCCQIRPLVTGGDANTNISVFLLVSTAGRRG